ncbi:unnamed protein product [Ambrosiozyma monospora]|uniref:Unnamed protein product n=1 Tax=Ambrosiozyma monospora TaxID=43982 RepID=A0A9W6T6D7_AMBMO|nr:unnamed protein product [Ambrosiozyma monospora]
MQAIVYYGKGDVRFDDSFPEPQISKPDDVKLKVLYASICGSDLKEMTVGDIFMKPNGNLISGLKSKEGCVMGHEISAQVIEVGDHVANFKPGDHVVVEVTGTCMDKERFEKSPRKHEGFCEACKAGHYNACDYLALTGLGFQHGGLAEYLVTGQHKLINF